MLDVITHNHTQVLHTINNWSLYINITVFFHSIFNTKFLFILNLNKLHGNLRQKVVLCKAGKFFQASVAQVAFKFENKKK